VPSWYALICIVKFNIFEIKFNFENDGVGSGKGQSPLPSIMKFKNTCISIESKTFHPYEKCWTYVNKTIFARQWRHSLRNNHYRSLYFLLVPVSFRSPVNRIGLWLVYINTLIASVSRPPGLISNQVDKFLKREIGIVLSPVTFFRVFYICGHVCRGKKYLIIFDHLFA